MGRNLVLRKVFNLIFSVYILASLLFLFVRLLPGGPFDEAAEIHPLVKEKLDLLWGLNQPMFIQYYHFLKGLVSFDWGVSYFNVQGSVVRIIFSTFTQTLVLNLISFAFVILAALVLASILVMNQNKLIKALMTHFIFLGLSLPTLFVALMIFYFLAFKWSFFPMAFLNQASSYVLPVMALSFRPTFQLAQLIQKSWSETQQKTFIRGAYAKGLSVYHIHFFHALRHSMVPVLAWFPQLFINLFSGSLLVETIFSIRGMGYLFIESIAQRDYPLIIGEALFLGILVIFISSSFEVLREYLDPRLKEGI